MKNLFIIRGIPGSGKTTFANSICKVVVSADDYFTDINGNYNFDGDKLHTAHAYSKQQVELNMRLKINDIAVANTFTTNKEMKPYLKLAKKYDYRVFSIIVENRHGNNNIHDVPLDVIDKMTNRFNIQL